MSKNPSMKTDSSPVEVDRWKFIILSMYILILSMGILQISTFGIVFSNLLVEIGNEAQDTSTVTSIFVMTALITGLPANGLLRSLSSRKVGYIGAFCFFLGSVLCYFVTSVIQLVITFGIIKGFGFGLMITAACVAFTEYFIEKQNFYMNLGHLLTGVITAAFPILSTLSVKYYGDRGTILIIAAINAHGFFAALCFHPIGWHLKRKSNDAGSDEKNISTHVKKVSAEDSTESKSRGNLWMRFKSKVIDFDFVLFKELTFVSAAVGLSLVHASDIMYISFFPLLLSSVGFSDENTSFLMTAYLISDLVGKVFLCMLTAFVKIKNRYLILTGAIGMAVFRLVQGFSTNFIWTILIVSLMGFVRGFVENTQCVFFAEIYPQRFVTSYSLFLLVDGVIVSLVGQIISFAMGITSNTQVILYILSVSAVCCAIPWIIGMSYDYIKVKFLDKPT